VTWAGAPDGAARDEHVARDALAASLLRTPPSAIERYVQGLLPPFTAALARYDRDREYSWAAPGHQGGVAFLKSPIGRMFFDFYGENLFRTDMGIERAALGSLLGHLGPIGESEQYIARVFGAHRSYSVLTGTSGSNRALMSVQCLKKGAA
jgi:arginine decarboxylase